jgi:hypothetical protein
VLKQYRVAARARGIVWDLSAEEFAVITASTCAYCGLPPRTVARPSKNGWFIYNGIDRVDSGLGYVVGNVVACCPICNHAKRDMTLSVFVAWIKRLAAHERERDRL